MGPKVTVDSATLMNKGLEIIEARYLFDLPPNQPEVIVHPQSVIHGIVAFGDGSMLAQMSAPDMRTPIAHCLAWPERRPAASPRLDLTALGQLSFEAPDPARFPACALPERRLMKADGQPIFSMQPMKSPSRPFSMARSVSSKSPK